MQTQKNDQNSYESLDIALRESKKFIVIGLTGRTGSGCSTAASLITAESLQLPDPSNSHYQDNEKRKYQIIKKYIDSNWNKFEWLQIKSVITRFILELNLSSFEYLVHTHLGAELSAVKSSFRKIKREYEELHYYVVDLTKKEESSSEEIQGKMEQAYDLYINRLPEFANAIRRCLQEIAPGGYTKIYQYVGDNIRSSGTADNKNFSPEKLFTLPKTINKIIKSIRHACTQKNKPCYIVIDAIRNPYEASFLKERYESLRVCRRLTFLRELAYEKETYLLP